MAIIFQVLGVLLALFFIFLTYMNTKTWRWVHVTFTFFVFGATIAFLVYAAMTLRTRLAWQDYHDDLEKKVATATEQVELLTQGDPKDLENKTPSVASLSADLARAISDRGRVWRGLVATGAPDASGALTLTTAPPQDPNLPAQPAPGKHNIDPKTILYAFREAANPEGIAVPVYYVGEYAVTAVADTTLTIAPTMPQAADQKIAAGQQGGWVLYEVSPIDGHEWFIGLDQGQLAALIQQPVTGLPPAEHQKLVETYVNDGQPADEASIPPDNLWFEVEFTQKHTVTVDADAVNSLDGELFNADGQALLDRLRQAKPGEAPAAIEFEPGDKAIFDQETANQLATDGIATKGQPIYRRKLNDYELRFHQIARRIVEIDTRMRTLKADSDTTAAATAKAAAQEVVLQELNTKLKADLDKIQNFELPELTKYADQLAARLAAVQAELSGLYRSNKALGKELAETSARLTEEIDRRTREATASR